METVHRKTGSKELPALIWEQQIVKRITDLMELNKNADEDSVYIIKLPTEETDHDICYYKTYFCILYLLWFSSGKLEVNIS